MEITIQSYGGLMTLSNKPVPKRPIHNQLQNANLVTACYHCTSLLEAKSLLEGFLMCGAAFKEKHTTYQMPSEHTFSFNLDL